MGSVEKKIKYSPWRDNSWYRMRSWRGACLRLESTVSNYAVNTNTKETPMPLNAVLCFRYLCKKRCRKIRGTCYPFSFLTHCSVPAVVVLYFHHTFSWVPKWQEMLSPIRRPVYKLPPVSLFTITTQTSSDSFFWIILLQCKLICHLRTESQGRQISLGHRLGLVQITPMFSGYRGLSHF